ncbi:unnamed protein product [Fusarium graminearum]|nr:unnamed protein product [Fusarium graminearum]
MEPPKDQSICCFVESTGSASHLASEQRLTTYTTMIVQTHESMTGYKLAAAFLNWLSLAGFVLLPGTFTSLNQAIVVETQAGREMQKAVQNTPLIAISVICCFVSGAGIGHVIWKCQHNPVWLVDRIFM